MQNKQPSTHSIKPSLLQGAAWLSCLFEDMDTWGLWPEWKRCQRATVFFIEVGQIFEVYLLSAGKSMGLKPPFAMASVHMLQW